MKRKIITLVLTALLALGAAAALAACDGGTSAEKPPTGVKEITTSQQLSSNVRYTNYQVIVEADVDWDNMSDSEKQKIIDYAFKESRKQAAENDINNFNIIAMKEGGEPSTVLFMWNGGNEEVFLYSDGKPTSSIPIPAE